MNIVVTGAARGIGKAIAEKFASEKNNIFLCARNEIGLSATVAELKNNFPLCNIYSMDADISIKENADAFANFCLQYAVPDILINNAGCFLPTRTSGKVGFSVGFTQINYNIKYQNSTKKSKTNYFNINFFAKIS